MITYDVAAIVPGCVQERLAAAPVPSADAADVVFAVAKNGLEVPTSDAVKLVTSAGSKKLS